MFSENMKPLKLGFVALTDAAPLVVAQRLGLYQQAGLNVKLCRQPSWSTLRDKLIFGELQAAQLLSPMVLTLQKPMRAPLVLSRGGNALLVSNALYDALNGAKGGLNERPLRVGTVFPFSMHSLQLRQWLKRLGVEADGQQAEATARFEVVPPARMVKALKEGQLDVCCVGEPYGTLAEFEHVGHRVAHSDEFWPSWPEKVLGLTEAGALALGEQLPRLVSAVEQACQWLETDATNRKQAAIWMADEEVLNLPVQVIEKSLLRTEGLSFRFGAVNDAAGGACTIESWFPDFSAQVLELERTWFAGDVHRTISMQNCPFL